MNIWENNIPLKNSLHEGQVEGRPDPTPKEVWAIVADIGDDIVRCAQERSGDGQKWVTSKDIEERMFRIMYWMNHIRQKKLFAEKAVEDHNRQVMERASRSVDGAEHE